MALNETMQLVDCCRAREIGLYRGLECMGYRHDATARLHDSYICWTGDTAVDCLSGYRRGDTRHLAWSGASLIDLDAQCRECEYMM